MSDNTKIEWTDATANVINGCTVKSAGCIGCYAMKQAHRFPVRRGLTKMTNGGMVWTGEVRFNEAALLQVLKWKKPRMIFWNAHGDMFHENVPDEWIDRCFAVMALTPHHTHQVLTKRADRMRAYFADPALVVRRDDAVRAINRSGARRGKGCSPWALDKGVALINVWLGVSVEDQRAADERIPDLLATPAAVRWISAEPLLGPVNLNRLHHDGIVYVDALNGLHGILVPLQGTNAKLDWVVCGGESGPKARPMHPDWARSLRDQCADAGVPFLFKQWGEFGPVEHEATVASLRNVTVRYGKKAAGRHLDGVLHDEYPAREARQ